MKCVRDLLRVDEIRVPEGRRNTDPLAIKNLADSMAHIGLQCPITVRITEDDDGSYVDLVAGAHRLEAAKLLGWIDIEGMVMPSSATDADAEMWEISENLHRAELTALQRAELRDRYAVLVEQRARDKEVSAQLAQKPQSGVGQGVGGGRPESGLSLAARELDVPRDQLRRDRKIASIAPEAKEEAVRLGLDDNQSALLKVAAAPKESQAQQVRQIVEARKRERTARAEPAAEPPATEDEVFRALTAEVRKWAAKADRDTLDRAWNRVVEYKENML